MNTAGEEHNYWEISQEMTPFPPLLDKEVAAFKLRSSRTEENDTAGELRFGFWKAPSLSAHTPVGCMESSSEALL